ncbi:unnamed protein product [Lota lota]
MRPYGERDQLWSLGTALLTSPDCPTGNGGERRSPVSPPLKPTRAVLTAASITRLDWLGRRGFCVALG